MSELHFLAFLKKFVFCPLSNDTRNVLPGMIINIKIDKDVVQII